MPHSKDYARRLLKRLDMPANVELMLSRPSYWDETVCRLYFSQCDETLFNRPRDGLKMAQIAPRLALLVPEQSSQAGRLRHRSLTVEAYGLLGSAHRANRQLVDAQRQYKTALRIVESEGIGGLTLADLHRRWSVLQICLKRFSGALELIDSAITVYRANDESKLLAEALVIRAAVHGNSGNFKAAIEDCGECLRMTPNPNHAPLTYYSALHNLAYCCSYGRMDDLSLAMRYLRGARRANTVRQSVAKAKLGWIEGRIMIRQGSTRRGEAVLVKAISELETLGAAFETALAALELTQLWLHECAEWRRVKDLAVRVYRRFREQSADSEAIAALSLWLEASKAETLTIEQVEEIQQTIESRLAPGSCCQKQDRSTRR